MAGLSLFCGHGVSDDLLGPLHHRQGSFVISMPMV